MPHLHEPVQFKFRWVDEHGHETGLRKKPGHFTGLELALDETVIPVDAIANLDCRGNRMVLSVALENGDLFSCVIAVSGTDVDRLRLAINEFRSEALATAERKRLQDEGRSSAYRDQTCPYCAATIVLTDRPPSPQVYCEYCDTLFTCGQSSLDTSFEQRYRICPECQMYSHPRKFTIFYFYFLLVINGWYSDSTIRCSACMRPDAWKMMFGNLFGLIGLPVATVQLYRAYAGRRGKGPLAGLDDANILANRKRIDAALDRYDLVMDNVPVNAGVKYNIARGLAQKNEWQHAETMFQMSLEDCSNYWPSIGGLVEALAAQEKTDEIQVLRQRLGLNPEPGPAEGDLTSDADTD